MEKNRLLELKNITVLKGSSQMVLDSISLNIDEGENLAILGPNGAGKSSLIKIITREYYPIDQVEESSFKILGHDNWDVFELRSLFGIVSNELQFTCTRDITGLEMVLSGFFSSIGLFRETVTDQMKRKAQEIIEFLEIVPLQNKIMSQMSSGEARRFLIGRALVHNPKALILDEPSNSLDLHAHHKFTNILRKITKAGTSIILVTHNLLDIIPEINRVVLMKNGKIFKDGGKESILTTESISKLFEASVEIKTKDGYYYALRA